MLACVSYGRAHSWGLPEPYIYIRCIYGIIGREITKYTVVYGVNLQFWPTLHIVRYVARHMQDTACSKFFYSKDEHHCKHVYIQNISANI
jgi:hypothetical protein